MDLSRSGKESGDILRESGKGAPAPTIRLGQVPRVSLWKRGVGIIDLILRGCAIAATLGAAVVVGTTNQFSRFQASNANLPTFTFFLAGNSITCAYLVLSLPLSIFCILRPHIVGSRVVLLIFDTLALGLTMSAASSAAAIVYLAHKGSPSGNWPALCQQFSEFCPRVNGAVMGSLLGVSILVVLVLLSAFALCRNQKL